MAAVVRPDCAIWACEFRILKSIETKPVVLAGRSKIIFGFGILKYSKVSFAEKPAYLLLQLSLGIGSDDNFTISSTDLGFIKSALNESSNARPTASKCATRRSILLKFTNFYSLSASRIFIRC